MNLIALATINQPLINLGWPLACLPVCLPVYMSACLAGWLACVPYPARAGAGVSGAVALWC
eukprot:COSAG06_NODE_39685_length_409_cov_36.912903_1_plen_60_part_01